ncbi:MAG: hypothetical protein WBZ36_24815 [Candidatus Nitrosopolaris sp.]|jgi:hypothetical protein
MSDQAAKKKEVNIIEPSISDRVQAISGMINILDNLVKDMKENTKDLQDLKRKKAELFASL